MNFALDNYNRRQCEQLDSELPLAELNQFIYQKYQV